MQTTYSIPKVSVCVVTYNQENYISKCLQSIIDQEVNFEFEVIIGDDFSTDGTRKIVEEFSKKYPAKIITVFLDKNIGPYKNYTSTHSIAQGVYVAHCDGDDYWYPGKLQAQVDFLDNNPEISASFTNAKSGGSIKYKKLECGTYRTKDILKRVFTRNLCVHSSIMERRKPTQSALQLQDEFFDFEMYWEKHGQSYIHIDHHVFVNYSKSTLGISRSKNYIQSLKRSLARISTSDIDKKTLEEMFFDFSLMEYFSDPTRNHRPAVSKAIKNKYSLFPIIKLLTPKVFYVSAKAIKRLVSNF